MTEEPSGPTRGGTPYLDALVELRDARDPTRLMVPGHKGGRGASPRLAAAFGAGAGTVLGLDIPLHVRGIDVGPPDPPPLVRAQQLAAEAWGARSTHFIVGGGSQANHIICLALAIQARGRACHVAVQRNVHQSVIYGLVLAGATVSWLDPEIDPDFGIQHCVTPEQLGQTLAEHEGRQLDAVIVVSPTYYGAVSDVPGLARVLRECRSDGTLLVVDEAWGAHFPFHSRFPETAVTAGADIVVSSTHKILGSLTQSAMLHVAPTASDRLAKAVEQAIDKARNLVKTTSPSSLLMASLDAARAYACGDGGKMLGQAAAHADELRSSVRAARLRGIKVIDESVTRRNRSVAAFDPLRVTLDVRGTGLTGREVQKALWRPGHGGVEIEFCTDELVVFLFGVGDGAEDKVETIVNALSRLPAPDGGARSLAGQLSPQTQELFQRIGAPRVEVGLREAFLGATQARALRDSANWVCAEMVAPYPPGIAIVMPGELLTPELVAYLVRIRDTGAEFADCRDLHLGEIQVLVGGGTVGLAGSRPPATHQAPADGG